MIRWIQLTGFALLLFLCWTIYRDLTSDPNGLLGLLIGIPLLYVPVLFLAFRLIFAQKVDLPRKVAASFADLFIVSHAFNFVFYAQGNRWGAFLTIVIAVITGLTAFIAALFPRKKPRSNLVQTQSEKLTDRQSGSLN